MVEDLGRRVWTSVINFTHRHAVFPCNALPPSFPLSLAHANSSKRNLVTSWNTHKSTSLLKGSEIGKTRCNVLPSSSPPFFPFLSLSRARIHPRPSLYDAYMSGHVCIQRGFLGSVKSGVSWAATDDIIGTKARTLSTFRMHAKYQCFLWDKG